MNNLYPRSTLASVNISLEKIKDAKRSLIEDMTNRDVRNDPNALVEINEMHQLFEDAIRIQQSVAAHTDTTFTERDVDAMRKLERQKVTQKKIAEYFGTNPTTINRILNGKGPVK